MAPDWLLLARMQDIIRTSGYNNISLADVRRQLENEFGTDLSGRKTFIKEQTQLFLQSKNQGNVVEEEEEESDVVGAPDSELTVRLQELVRTMVPATVRQTLQEYGMELLVRDDAEGDIGQVDPEENKESVSVVKEIGRAPELELAACLHDFIQTSDLTTITPTDIRQKLEHVFGVDLSARKALIQEKFDLALDTYMRNIGKEDSEEEEKESVDKVIKDVKPRRVSIMFSLSPKLQNFVGSLRLTRNQVITNVWEYIKEKNLQEPTDKRIIVCDEALRALFGVDSMSMFKMNEEITKHLWIHKESAESSQKGMPSRGRRGGSDEGKKAAKKQKRGG